MLDGEGRADFGLTTPGQEAESDVWVMSLGFASPKKGLFEPLYSVRAVRSGQDLACRGRLKAVAEFAEGPVSLVGVLSVLVDSGPRQMALPNSWAVFGGFKQGERALQKIGRRFLWFRF
jgi:hypothetical protein